MQLGRTNVLALAVLGIPFLLATLGVAFGYLTGGEWHELTVIELGLAETYLLGGAALKGIRALAERYPTKGQDETAP